jgi:CheY-like chemotaxis protein
LQNVPFSSVNREVHDVDAAAPIKPDLLIVDDDPLITDTLDFVLGRDFSVHVAESRVQAKSVLRQLESPPELALVDLGLPPTPHRPDEGFRLINELLALSPDIKILVLSGQNDEDNARHARALGAKIGRDVDQVVSDHRSISLRRSGIEKLRHSCRDLGGSEGLRDQHAIPHVYGTADRNKEPSFILARRNTGTFAFRSCS